MAQKYVLCRKGAPTFSRLFSLAVFTYFRLMGFLYPLFLLSGICLLIPVVIHLFNLRRYKHEYFPDLRFLRQIQLASKQSAKLQRKWLLLLRLLFLTMLVLAFAQPFLAGRRNADAREAITVIYVDNSYSMSATAGMESLLQRAKSQAENLVHALPESARFLVLSNDRMTATRPLTRTEALAAIKAITLTGQSVSMERILGSIALAQEDEPHESWQVYLFSDFQKATWRSERPFPEKLAGTSFYLYPFQNASDANLFIDTAFFLNPFATASGPNTLIVRVKKNGDLQEPDGHLQVAVNGQIRAIRQLPVMKDSIWQDTLPLQLGMAAWQKLTVSLTGRNNALHFDDTFRMAVHTGTGLSVLVVAPEGVSPYLRTAFLSMNGCTMDVQQTANITGVGWQKYSLIVLQNANGLPASLEHAVADALERGQNILIFPAETADISMLNASVGKLVNIRFEPLDTTKQQVALLQKAHPLIKGMFEQVPDNVQLPAVARHFPLTAALSANPQDVMTFRDGKSFLAQYDAGNGKLFLCASPLDDESSNFPLSYFFAPLLYNMAAQDGSENSLYVTVGSNDPAVIRTTGNTDRSVWHMQRPGFDAVPPQRPSGRNMDIFAGVVAREPGFYVLRQENGNDSAWIALNADSRESYPERMERKDLEQFLKPYRLHWLNDDQIRRNGWMLSSTPFPLWKIAILAALLCLGLESILLISPKWLHRTRQSRPV